MKKPISLAAVLALLFASIASLHSAPRPGFGSLFYEGQVVRTVVPPAAMKKPGTDNLYAIPEGAEGQLPVIAVAPGDKGYRGGKWAFHLVTWNVAPTLLTSAEAVLAAEALGDVTITRIGEMDFKCPVQP